MLVLPYRAHAAAQTWNGTSTNTWNTTGNWSPTGVPSASSTLTFDASIGSIKLSLVLPAAATANSLTFKNTGTSGFTFDTAGTSNVLTVSGSGGIVNNNASTQTFHTIVTASAAQTWSATSGALAFDNVRISSSGALTLTGTNAITIGNNSTSLTNTFAGTATLTNNASNVTIGAVNLSNSGTNRNLTINGSGAAKITGVVSNGGGGSTASSLTYSGTGTLTLSGANTYGGGTTLSGGTLNINNASALGSGGFTVNGGTIDNTSAGLVAVNNAVTLGSDLAFTGTQNLTLAGSLSLGTANRTFTINGGNLTVGGVVSQSSGTRGLLKSGAGTLTLTNAGNTYSGVTTINGGTLSITSIGNGGSASTLGASSSAAGNLIINGGTLQFAGTAAVSSNRSFTIGTSGATLDASGTGSGTLNLTSTTAPSFSSANTISSLTLTGSSTNLNTFAGTLANNGSSVTSLTKNGTGTWVLTGANSYTGVTTVSNGTLAFGASNVLGSGAVTVAGGTLAIGANSDSVGAVTLSSGNITGSTGVLTGSSYSVTNASGTASISAILGGSGTLTKSGAGTLVLSGANTYTGATTLNAGTLQISADNNLGTAPGTATWAQLTLGGGALDTTATFTLNANRNLLLNAGANNISAESGTTLTYGGSIGGSGNITFGNNGTGTGTVTLAGATSNTYGGSFGVNGGTVIAAMTSGATVNNGGATVVNVGDGSGSAGSAVLQLNGNQQLDQGTALTLNSDGKLVLNNVTESLNQISGSGLIDLATSGALSVGTYSAASTFSGVISGAGSLTKLGSAMFTLSGANTYSGTTSLNNGTLTLGNTLALQNSTLAMNGGTLSFGALSAATLGGLSGSGNVSLGAVASTVGGNNSSTTYSGVLSGAGGSLTKTGTGTLTLSGANTYTGPTTISQGTIAVASNAPSGAAGALGNATSAVVINDGNTGANNTGLIIATSGVTVGRDVTVTNNGSGTVTLGGATGLTSATGAYTGNIVLNRNTTLQADTGTNVTFGTGVISGAGNITKDGLGTVTLTSANTFTGAVTVSNGTLVASSAADVSGGFYALGTHNALADTTVVTVNTGATLAVSSTNTGGIYSTDTHQYMTMSLSGTLTNLAGNSTWLGNVTLGGNATISNAAATGNANALFVGAEVPYAPLYFNLNNQTLTFAGTGDTYVTGMIGNSNGLDSGNVVLDGTGTVYFYGNRNYYTGTTTVNSGKLVLMDRNVAATVNVGIVGSKLTIGNGVGAADSAVVQEYRSDEIADSVPITINSDGLLDLGTYSRADTIGALTLNGGHTSSGTGMLYLNSSVDVNNRISDNTAATSTMDGRITFNGTNNVTVNGSNTLLVNAWIASGGFKKLGTGTMTLTYDNYNGGNGYDGTTEVAGGILNIRNGGALGLYLGGTAAAGTTVDAGATLQLDNTLTNINVAGERLVLNGDGYTAGAGALQSLAGSNSWAGPIVVGSNTRINTDSGTLTLSGVITGSASGTTQTLTIGGSGNTNATSVIADNRDTNSPFNDLHTGTLALTKDGSGTLTLSNAGGDTFTGAIAVNGGTLAVTADNVLASHVNTVDVVNGATFAVSGGGTTTIAKLTGAGNTPTTLGGVVSIAASTSLVVNNSAADSFSGTLTGSGLFQKQGAGTFTFTSVANTSAFNFAGEVRLAGGVSAGTLEFQGGTGTLNTSTNALSLGTLTLTGGTLLLTNAYINVGTLNITGNTILDFGTSGHSILNAGNIYIAAGAIVTVKNWSSEVDFLFANSDFRVDSATGQVSIRNQIGTGSTYTPEDQVWFQGDPQSPDGSHTTWIDNTTNYYSYANHEIRPVPEPSTYGALFLTGALGLFAFKRFRPRKVS